MNAALHEHNLFISRNFDRGAALLQPPVKQRVWRRGVWGDSYMEKQMGTMLLALEDGLNTGGRVEPAD
jgi:hypothetical protein